MFTPKFNTKVFVTCSVEGVKDEQIDPRLCLMPDSAKELAALLNAEASCTVIPYDAPPAGQMHGVFAVTAQVPWFAIQWPGAVPDVLRTITANFNAGELAMWWVRSTDPATALRQCLAEINAGLSDAFANQR